MVEAKFKKGDYIINRTSKCMGIIKSVTPKGYYTFKEYDGAMFDELKEEGYELQINYQKFYDLCTEEEKEKLDNIIKQKKRLTFLSTFFIF